MPRTIIAAIGACGLLFTAGCNERPPAAQPTAAQSAARRPVAGRPSDQNPLLGQPAPSFTTVDPEGAPIDFAKHLGKDVVMLDFWATWCGPCIMAMPDVQAVANEFKDRGLVFYAVNVGEDPDTVKQFLAQNQLEIPVAMDFDGQIQDAFHAEGIPHTILIGKDGRVQVDHRGYWRGLKDELTAQVAALLAGEDLAGSPAEGQ